MRVAGLALAALLASTAMAQETATVAPPAALVIDGIPPVPQSLAAATRPYLEFRTASFLGWDPASHAALIATRFGNAPQLHRVASPRGARTQLTFEPEPVAVAAYAPGKGDVLVAQKDRDGDEFYQLYRVDSGRLVLLTDGKSRNEFGAWDKEGVRVGYSSTRRDGTAADLYVVDPRDPKTDRMIARVADTGWQIIDFAPGGATALALHYLSVERSELFAVDVATGRMTRLTPEGEAASYGGAKYGPDGTLYVTTDRGGDFQRLGTLKAGKFAALNPETRWDVEHFDIAEDGSFIAYTINEAGASKLRLLDPKTGAARGEAKLPAGVISGLEIAPWGAVGFSMTSATSPADMYSLDSETLTATRWTSSETGGLDAAKNREPDLVAVKSFDGREVSGFLYRPDPAKFPGRRPLIVSIHGGPEGQSRPVFQGRTNYLLNELGIAVFLPNVRGSTGYGKAFVGLDNGPFKREDSVRDIGPLLDRLAADPAIDPARISVAGGSYGGYMCYASAIRYGQRLRSAQCTVAISNWVTFLENTQSYRRALRRVEYGDERDPKQRAKLLAISPMTRSKELRIPLFVVTGGNDPRVPASEADQMVAAVRANGGTAWHLLAKNEGHGYQKKENQDYNFWAALEFWQATLLK